jgi:nucleoid-associated protein
MHNIVTKILCKSGRVTFSTEHYQVDNDSNHQALMDKLLLSVQSHASKQYGHFDQERLSTPCYKALSSYALGQKPFAVIEQAWPEWVEQTFTELQDEVEYYLWLSQAGPDDNAPLSLFLFKQEESHFFNAKLRLNTGRCIYPSKLKYAAVIDPLKWQQHSQQYMTVICPKTADPVTEAFSRLISFHQSIDRAVETEEFLSMVERYANEVIPDKKKEVTSRVFNYCFDQDRQGQSVNVKKLSEYMDEQEPEAFEKYVAANLESAREDWHPDRRRVQRYTKFYGRDDNISISFSSMMFGDDILFDERNNTLTIRSLPKSLVEQLKRYMKKSS